MLGAQELGSSCCGQVSRHDGGLAEEPPPDHLHHRQCEHQLLADRILGNEKEAGEDNKYNASGKSTKGAARKEHLR
ncbi:hypothetical protein GCM10011385_17090 [Nitratireductor aestuarii]|uniref:Uncharacterized protein n=1 Tax=Nitratireductor aestuarii TaxID=1735103 RepID=A0A916RNI9_9HYPH|nr:hypothetical protein GCM10011385_17090 [Nitratireductor aestuarii]